MENVSLFYFVFIIEIKCLHFFCELPLFLQGVFFLIDLLALFTY